MRKVLIVLTLLLCTGCPQSRPIYVVEETATTIHKKSAATRADIYNKIADEIESGRVKTVNECVDFSNPLFLTSAQDYIQSINRLRQRRLNGADETLPPNAADVFRQFAREYEYAAR